MKLKDKKILITGATGQVAGALSRGLAKDNDVYAMARFSQPGSREALEEAGVKTCYGDFVKGEFDTPEDIDYLIHSAANTRPKDMEEAMRDNVEGTALLMNQYRNVKAFLHISATGCYLPHSDPFYKYKETDEIGGGTPFSPLYGISKSIGEGVVRSLALVLNLPTTIARLNAAYGGPYADGGLPGRQLEAVLNGETITLPNPKLCKAVLSPIHEDDLTTHIEPLLAAASKPATIVNWGGDEPVEVETWVRYLGQLVGKEPNIQYDDSSFVASAVQDPSKRISLGCECKVNWKDGMRRMVADRHPEMEIQSL